MEWLTEGFASLQAALFEIVFQPLAFAIGLGGVLELVFDATGWLLVGLIQLALMLALIAPWSVGDKPSRCTTGTRFASTCSTPWFTVWASSACCSFSR